MLPETTVEQAYERAESIRRTIEQTAFTITTNALPIRVTMSFGIAGRESFSQTTDEIIHNADTALYHSKLSGRNQVYTYTNEKYIDFPQDQDKQNVLSAPPEASQTVLSPARVNSYRIGEERSSEPPGRKGSAGSDPTSNAERFDPPAPLRSSKFSVNLFIGLLTLASSVSFAIVCQGMGPLWQLAGSTDWISLLMIAVLIAASEWFSMSLYFKQTSVSTSAIPILAGYLLFGPVGTFVVSAVVSIVLFIKYRSPVSRLVFNFSNHLLAGSLSISLMLLSGKPFLEWHALPQLLLSLAAATIMYFVTTWSIAAGMSIQPYAQTPQSLEMVL